VRKNEDGGMSRVRVNVPVYSNPSTPVPPLRYDISLIPHQQDGESFVYFHDSMSYSEPDMMLGAGIESILQTFDGRSTLSDLHKKYFKSSGISLHDLLSFVSDLDSKRLLHSPYFKAYATAHEAAFEQASERYPSCQGSCYPEEASALKQWLDVQFSSSGNGTATSFKALFAPHIDYRVGMETYVKAFSSVKNVQPKRVVILATSHYAGYYNRLYDNKPFIISGKSQVTPLGTSRVAKSLYEEASKLDGSAYGISINDRAHRIEHSVELHVVMAQYIWGKEVEVLPVLVGSFEESMLVPTGNQGRQIAKMASFLRSLDDGNTFFLISGDQAHFGKKFGDRKPAKTIFPDVQAFDKTYLDMASDSNHAAMQELMASNADKYRICGYPPLMLFLRAFPEARGTQLHYAFWDEHEYESGVTYAAIGYG